MSRALCSPTSLSFIHDRHAFQHVSSIRTAHRRLRLAKHVQLHSSKLPAEELRALRLTFYGFSVISAGVASLISIPQLLGALGHAPNALPLEDVLTNIGINATAVTVFALLFRSDWKARDKQIARLEREERLGALTVELANKQVLPLTKLRGAARLVIVAGTQAQVAAAVAAAEPYKEALMQRGVLVVPVPIYETDGSSTSGLPPPEKEDLRWRATPLRSRDWLDWFKTQLSLSKAVSDNGLYVGLRMDGRVRASGMGTPPWATFAAQLPPTDSWGGLMDGFDGKV